MCFWGSLHWLSESEKIGKAYDLKALESKITKQNKKEPNQDSQIGQG